MDEREIDRGGADRPAGSTGGGTGGSAGAANTPPFGGAGAPGREGPGASGEPMHGIAAARSPMGERGTRSGRAGEQTSSGQDGEVKERARERMGEMRDEAGSRADDMLSRAAEGLDSAAERLDSFADRQQAQGGTRNRVGRMAHGTAETVESVARYLRDNDVEGLKSDLERQVRTSPVQTLLIAVAAGWVIGKILR